MKFLIFIFCFMFSFVIWAGAFHEAVKKGDINVIALYIKGGVDVDVKSVFGETALHKASFAGKIELISLLIKHGADVNAETKWSRRTPLHLASAGGQTEVILLLIKHGADVNAQDARDRTPLDVAFLDERYKAASLLIEHGGRVNSINSESVLYHRQTIVAPAPERDIERYDPMLVEQQ